MRWIYYAAVFNGFFLSLAVSFIKTRNTSGKILLSILVLVLTLGLLETIFMQYANGFAFGAGLSLEFFVGPLIWLFVQSLTAANFRFSNTQLWHFLPALAVVFGILMLNLGIFGGFDRGTLTHSNPILAAWVFAKAVFLFSYFIPAVLVWRKTLKIAPKNLQKFGRPVSLIFLILGMLLSFIYITFLANFFGLTMFPDSDRYSLLLTSGIIYVLGFLVIIERRTLNGFYTQIPGGNDLALRPKVKKLENLMEKEKVFLDPDFSAKDFLKALDVNPATLNRLFFLAYAKGPLETLNGFRVEEFKKNVKGTQGGENILELAFAAGFNSKATFYRAFRDKEGITPGEYLKTL